MTRNKNRKESIRKRAAAEGVGVARATMLHDRERNLPAEITEALRREDALSWTLGWRGGESHDHSSRPIITVPFNTDSTSTFRATPHFIIEQGVHQQRFHMMDRIGREVKRTGAANAHIVDSDDHSMITNLAIQHEMRKIVMKSAGVDTFDELRRYFINDESVPLRSTPRYDFLFIYDFEFAMMGASKETLGDLKFLLENGHETGIHIIVSSKDQAEDVWALSEKLRTVTFGPDDSLLDDGTISVIHKGNWIHLESGYPFDAVEIGDSGPDFALLNLLNYDGFGIGEIKLTKTANGGLITTVESATSKDDARYMSDIDRIIRALDHEIREVARKELGVNASFNTEGLRLVAQERMGAFGPHLKPADIPVR